MVFNDIKAFTKFISPNRTPNDLLGICKVFKKTFETTPLIFKNCLLHLAGFWPLLNLTINIKPSKSMRVELFKLLQFFH